MKFALISWYGSGTNLLRSFVNSHPDILLHKEMFCLAAGFNACTEPHGVRTAMLDGAFSADRRIVGIDLKYDQINDEVEDYLLKNNTNIIHLGRDPLRTVWYNAKHVSSAALHAHVTKINSSVQRVRQLFAGGHYLELTYEDMSRGYQVDSLPVDFEQRLLEFLGAPYCRLQLQPTHSTKPLKVRT